MKIKTIEQAREGRVSVQLTGSPDFFTDEVSVTITVPPCGHAESTAPPNYDPAAAVEVMAENYQRASARIGELEGQVAAAQEAREIETRRADKAVADRAKLATTLAEIKGHITVEGITKAVEMALFVDPREAHIPLNEIDKAATLLGKAVANVRTTLYFESP